MNNLIEYFSNNCNEDSSEPCCDLDNQKCCKGDQCFSKSQLDKMCGENSYFDFGIQDCKCNDSDKPYHIDNQCFTYDEADEHCKTQNERMVFSSVSDECICDPLKYPFHLNENKCYSQKEANKLCSNEVKNGMKYSDLHGGCLCMDDKPIEGKTGCEKASSEQLKNLKENNDIECKKIDQHTEWDQKLQSCICKQGYVDSDSGKCTRCIDFFKNCKECNNDNDACKICKKGYILENGSCIEPDCEKIYSSNSEFRGSKCQCKPGFSFKNGKCLSRDDIRCSRIKGSFSENGKCVCPKGYKKNMRKRICECKSPNTEFDNKCMTSDEADKLCESKDPFSFYSYYIEECVCTENYEKIYSKCQNKLEYCTNENILINGVIDNGKCACPSDKPHKFEKHCYNMDEMNTVKKLKDRQKDIKDVEKKIIDCIQNQEKCNKIIEDKYVNCTQSDSYKCKLINEYVDKNINTKCQNELENTSKFRNEIFECLAKDKLTSLISEEEEKPVKKDEVDINEKQKAKESAQKEEKLSKEGNLCTTHNSGRIVNNSACSPNDNKLFCKVQEPIKGVGGYKQTHFLGNCTKRKKIGEDCVLDWSGINPCNTDSFCNTEQDTSCEHSNPLNISYCNGICEKKVIGLQKETKKQASEKGTGTPPLSVPKRFNTTWGNMTLSTSDDITLGKYDGKPDGRPDGRIRGKYNPKTRTSKGFWYQSKSDVRCGFPRNGTWYWGQYVWYFNEDETSFKGEGRNCDEEPISLDLSKDMEGTLQKETKKQASEKGIDTQKEAKQEKETCKSNYTYDSDVKSCVYNFPDGDELTNKIKTALANDPKVQLEKFKRLISDNNSGDKFFWISFRKFKQRPSIIHTPSSWENNRWLQVTNSFIGPVSSNGKKIMKRGKIYDEFTYKDNYLQTPPYDPTNTNYTDKKYNMLFVTDMTVKLFQEYYPTDKKYYVQWRKENGEWLTSDDQPYRIFEENNEAYAMLEMNNEHLQFLEESHRKKYLDSDSSAIWGNVQYDNKYKTDKIYYKSRAYLFVIPGTEFLNIIFKINDKMHTGIGDLDDRIGFYQIGNKLNIDMSDFEKRKFMITEQEKKVIGSQKEVKNSMCNIRCYEDNIKCPNEEPNEANVDDFTNEIERLNSKCCHSKKIPDISSLVDWCETQRKLEENQRKDELLKEKYPIPKTHDEADMLTEKDLFFTFEIHKQKRCDSDDECEVAGCNKKIGRCHVVSCEENSDCSFDNNIRAGYCDPPAYMEKKGVCLNFDKDYCLIHGKLDDHSKCRNKKDQDNKCLKSFYTDYGGPDRHKYKCVSKTEYDDAESKRNTQCFANVEDNSYFCGKKLKCKPNNDGWSGKCN
jgi:hypothetical protein